MTKSKILIYLCLSFIIIILIISLLNGFGTESEKVNQYYNQEVILEGIIINEPEQRINQQKFVIKTERIDSSASPQNDKGATPQNDNKNSHPEQSEGSNIVRIRVLITTELYPKYKYGDKLKISGILREPAVFDDFDYRAYLAKDKIHLVIYYS
ncbi:DUF4131 domain-containing protein, partial [candidate division KSB1 bacterium]|nr:DUF4131 domain-containing protein [candidate division KSB1 bacterium]